MKHHHSRLLPIYISIAVAVGIFIGSFYASLFPPGKFSLLNPSNNKLIDLLYLVEDQYVDEVDLNDVIERALPHVLAELDPHSTYFPADEVEASMQELNGSFSGIGVQFAIYQDTVRVVKVIDGGPSEKVGLHPGDRIIAIDGKPFVGPQLTNDDVLKNLKGAAGTKVKVLVKRHGEKKDLAFTINRGDVPVKSIDACYMINPTTGYLRINAWGSTTYSEFISNMIVLNTHGADNLVLDLRGNGGGYLEAAVQVANEFLPKGSLIVYTEGRRFPRENYRSDGRGSFRNMQLIVLVDETSASASEIFAGAMQDNDRATIIGRRTFGKGLVQVPIEFPDGSMMRLTRARYYTPSGRCVQKPYTPGDVTYEEDLLLRAESGEYFNPDSVKLNGPKFKTTHGRVVYGGGGIMPDHFVPRDTTGYTTYYKDVYNNGLMSSFAYQFVDNHRDELQKCTSYEEVCAYLNKRNIVEEFASFAETSGTKRRNLMIRTSHDLIERMVTGFIISDVLSIEQTVEYSNLTDPAVLRSLELINSGMANPIGTKQQEQKLQKTALLSQPSHALGQMARLSNVLAIIARRSTNAFICNA